MRRKLSVLLIAVGLLVGAATPAYAGNNAVTANPGNSGGVCFVVNHHAGGGIATAKAANGLFINIAHNSAC